VGAAVLTATEGHEYYTGWRRSDGVGVTDGEGRPVRGLGDLLLWGARRYSRAVHDWAALEAARPRLNAYRIDAVINEVGLRWDDWLARNVLDTYELHEVHGPRGLHYVQRVWEVDLLAVRGQITTDPGEAGGHEAQRLTGVEEVEEDLANEISVHFAPRLASVGVYGRRVTFGADRGSYVAGDADSLLYPSLACQLSRQRYGPLQLSVQTTTTCDRTTASAIGRLKVGRHALPWSSVTYGGGADLLDYHEGDTVTVWDTRGAAFRGDPAIVDAVRLRDDGGAELDLRVPYDPLRAPRLSA
jgi:hypothetical protein